MYGLFLRDLDVSARIGVHDFERAAPQRLLINIALALEQAPEADEITAVTDYDFIRRDIHRILARGHIDLQESLCLAIIEACRAQPNVVAARISTRKPDVYPDAGAVGCRMVWIAEGCERADAILALGTD
jgi:dihydroneopterin aldolase